MRKFIWTVFLLLTVTAVALGAIGCKKEEEPQQNALHGLDLSSMQTEALCGEEYVFPELDVYDDNGEKYSVTWTVTFGEETVTPQNGSFVAEEPGEYTVTATVVFCGENVTASKKIVFTEKAENALHGLDLSSMQTEAFCGDEYVLPELDVYDDNGEDYSVTWTVTFGEETVTPQNGSFVAEEPGEYTVTAAVAFCGENVKRSVTVTFKRNVLHGLDLSAIPTSGAYSSEYVLPELDVWDDKGNVYTVTWTVVFGDEPVTPDNGRFGLDALGDYTVTASVEFSGATESCSATVSCYDAVAPETDRNTLPYVVTVNDEVDITVISVSDDLGVESVDYLVYEDYDEQNTVTVSGGKFIAQKACVYNVKVIVKDTFNTVTSVYNVAARTLPSEYEIESMDSEGSMYSFSGYVGGEQAELETEYVKNDTVGGRTGNFVLISAAQPAQNWTWIGLTPRNAVGHYAEMLEEFGADYPDICVTVPVYYVALHTWQDLKMPLADFVDAYASGTVQTQFLIMDEHGGSAVYIGGIFVEKGRRRVEETEVESLDSAGCLDSFRTLNNSGKLVELPIEFIENGAVGEGSQLRTGNFVRISNTLADDTVEPYPWIGIIPRQSKAHYQSLLDAYGDEYPDISVVIPMYSTADIGSFSVRGDMTNWYGDFVYEVNPAAATWYDLRMPLENFVYWYDNLKGNFILASCYGDIATDIYIGAVYVDKGRPAGTEFEVEGLGDAAAAESFNTYEGTTLTAFEKEYAEGVSLGGRSGNFVKMTNIRSDGSKLKYLWVGITPRHSKAHYQGLLDEYGASYPDISVVIPVYFEESNVTFFARGASRDEAWSADASNWGTQVTAAGGWYELRMPLADFVYWYDQISGQFIQIHLYAAGAPETAHFAFGGIYVEKGRPAADEWEVEQIADETAVESFTTYDGTTPTAFSKEYAGETTLGDRSGNFVKMTSALTDGATRKYLWVGITPRHSKAHYQGLLDEYGASYPDISVVIPVYFEEANVTFFARGASRDVAWSADASNWGTQVTAAGEWYELRMPLADFVYWYDQISGQFIQISLYAAGAPETAHFAFGGIYVEKGRPGSVFEVVSLEEQSDINSFATYNNVDPAQFPKEYVTGTVNGREGNFVRISNKLSDGTVVMYNYFGITPRYAKSHYQALLDEYGASYPDISVVIPVCLTGDSGSLTLRGGTDAWTNTVFSTDPVPDTWYDMKMPLENFVKWYDSLGSQFIYVSCWGNPAVETDIYIGGIYIEKGAEAAKVVEINDASAVGSFITYDGTTPTAFSKEYAGETALGDRSGNFVKMTSALTDGATRKYLWIGMTPAHTKDHYQTLLDEYGASYPDISVVIPVYFEEANLTLFARGASKDIVWSADASKWGSQVTSGAGWYELRMPLENFVYFYDQIDDQFIQISLYAAGAPEIAHFAFGEVYVDIGTAG